MICERIGMTTPRWRAGVLCSMTVAGVAAAALPAAATPADAGSAAPDVNSFASASADAVSAELYLETSLNGQPTGQLLAARQGPRGLLVSRADLRQIGLDGGVLAAGNGVNPGVDPGVNPGVNPGVDPGVNPGVNPGADPGVNPGAAADDSVALDAIAGLRYRYDAAAQTLALLADDSLRMPLALSVRPSAPPLQAQATPGAVINYDAVLHGARRQVAVAAIEARWFNARGVLSSSGVASVAGNSRRFIRHDSFWTEYDGATLRTLRLGDTITSSLAWNRALRIGGIQWGKSFALRPDLATFPTASIGGSAAVPSALSLYVNGVQQYSSDVPGGPFVLNQIGGINGAGEAVVVTRDALGRASAVSLPLYVDTRMLAAGLSEFSVEAGVPRNGFGMASFGYRGAPVATGSGRYGLTDRLTLEAHGELAPRLQNGGAGMLLSLGGLGVLDANLSVSASGAAGSGAQAGLGYRYVAPRLSIDLQSQRLAGNYRDLSARAGAPAPRALSRAALAGALGARLSFNASVTAYRAAAGDGGGGKPANLGAGAGRRDRIVSLGLTHAFAGGVFASASAYANLDQRASRGLFLSVSMALGGASAASVVVGAQDGALQRSISASAAPDLAGGAGWAVQDAAIGAAHLRAAQWQYLGQAGRLALTVQAHGQGQGSAALAIEGSGAVVLMDGMAQATRSVGDGFALVSTDGVARVPVLHEHRLIGVTDDSGHLLVPTMNANVGNVLAIDTTALAADRRVPLTTQTIAPRSLSGVLVRFPIETYQAANLILQDADGAPLPVGLPTRHRESGKRGMTGFDGMAFVDQLQAHNHLEVVIGDAANPANRANRANGASAATCVVAFDWQRVEGEPLPTIGPLRCIAAAPAPNRHHQEARP